MKAVLVSVRPKWCELIASGRKTIEVRKTKPKLEAPFKCYIYCTKRGRPLVFGSPVPTYVEENLVQTYGYSKAKADRIFGNLNGKVIGEFVCDRILAVDCDSVGLFDKGSHEYISDSACVSRDEFWQYARGLCAYGWHISAVEFYDNPKELSEFNGWRETKFGVANCLLQRAPQSWCYVDDNVIPN